jgi:hypothetical protein
MRSHKRSTTRTRLKNSLSPLRHFTEYLVDVFEKLLRENNLEHNSSRLSIRWLNSTPGIQPATNFTHNHPATLQSQHTIDLKHPYMRTEQPCIRGKQYCSGSSDLDGDTC